MFPRIEHINDVLPHIEGKPEFVVAKREWGTVIDYNYACKDTFSNRMSLECRGIKFGLDGQIIARPLHKFFNIGERDDTQDHVLPWSERHVVLEKLDGSMIHPAIVDGQLLWMTRMGVTDVAKEAAKRVTPDIESMARWFIDCGVTPIFEWISPVNRIVVGYDSDELVLIAMREMTTGKYRTMDEMKICAHGVMWRGPYSQVSTVPVVRSVFERVENVAEFLADAAALENAEGYVVRWHDGRMAKVKASAYVLMHRTKDSLTWEKDVLALCLAGKVDDAIPLLSAEDAAALTDYNQALQAMVGDLAEGIKKSVAEAHIALNGDRKRFALECVPTILRPLRSVAFRVWAGGDPADEIRNLLSRHTGSRTEVDEIRPLLGPLRWDRRMIMEAA